MSKVAFNERGMTYLGDPRKSDDKDPDQSVFQVRHVGAPVCVRAADVPRRPTLG